MAIRNTTDNFGSIAKWLHWVIALLFLMAYFFVYYRRWFTVEKTPENWTVLQLHLSIGMTILALVLVRIIWRNINKLPVPEPGTPLSHFMIRAGHYSLYAIMIIMPITGYIGTGANTEYFSLFDIPKFENTSLFTILVNDYMGMVFADFEKPVDFIHKQVLGSWAVWMLILGHILAALYHTYIRKDRTLSKMTNNYP